MPIQNDPILNNILQAAQNGRPEPEAEEDDPILQNILLAAGEVGQQVPKEDEGSPFLERIANVGQRLHSLGPGPLGFIASATGLLGEERQATAATTAVGVAGGVVGPFANLVELPAEISSIATLGEGRLTIFDRAADEVRLEMGKLQESVSIFAQGRGLTSEESRDLMSTGSFIGMTVPVMGAYKMAGLVTGIKSVPLPATSGIFVKDAAAGAVFGFSFSEGGIGTRMQNAVIGGVLDGLGTAVLLGLAVPILAIRNVRAFDKGQARGLAERIREVRDPASGAPHIVMEDAEAARSLAEIQTDEHFLAYSSKAQDILAQSADRAAFIQALTDEAVMTGEASHVILKDVRLTGRFAKAEGELVPELEKQFPNMVFDVARGPRTRAGTVDVIAGPRGLSNAQKRQYKLEGRFAGQKIMKRGTVYEYVGESTKGRIKARRQGSDRVVSLVDEDVTTFGMAARLEERTAEEGALVRDFVGWLDDKMDELARAHTTGVDPDAYRVAVANGEIEVPSESALRDVYAETSPVYPLEMGLAETGDAPRVAAIKAQLAQIDQQIQQALEIGDEQAVRVLLGEQAKMQAAIPESLDATQSIIDDGFEFVQIHEPHEPGVFGDYVELWARERGIVEYAQTRTAAGRFGPSRPIQTPGDMAAFKFHAREAYRRHMWDNLPGEDRALLESVQDEVMRLSERSLKGFSQVKSRAATLGFDAVLVPGGRVFFRDINTGMGFEAKSMEVARGFLDGNARQFREGFTRGAMPDLGSVPVGATAHLDMPDHLPLIVDEDTPIGPALDEALEIPSYRNLRDAFLAVERATGLKVWTRFLEPIDTALQGMRVEYRPFLNRIAEISKGLSIDDLVEVTHYWTEIEGQGLDDAAKRTVQKRLGLSPQQLTFEREARELFDVGFDIARRDLGVDLDYITDYYARLLPMAERTKNMPDMDAIEQILGRRLSRGEREFWQEMRSGSGNASFIERDPRLVLGKYFRSLMWQKHVGDVYRQVYPMVKPASVLVPGRVRRGENPLNIDALPAQTQKQVLDAVGGEQGLENLRGIMAETLHIARGRPVERSRPIRKILNKIAGGLGVKIPDETWDAAINIGMSNLYGATLGGRPRVMIRDFTSNMFNGWSRWSGKHAGASLADAINPNGFAEAFSVGALRAEALGLPQADAYFENIIRHLPVEGDGAVGTAVAGVIKAGLRTGQGMRRLSQWLLVPYSSMDDLNRAWAYHWAKREVLDRTDGLTRGQVAERIDDILPMFAPTVKQKFLDTWELRGRDAAVRFIGRMNADETHAIYGTLTSPTATRSSFGRIGGAFGTWSIWQAEVYANRVRQGTAKQRRAFWAKTFIAAGSLAAAGYALGVNLQSWLAPTSWFGWMPGGVFLDLAQAGGGITAGMSALDPNETTNATIRFAERVGRVQIPGAVLAKEIMGAAGADDPWMAAVHMSLGRTDKTNLNWAMEVQNNPDAVNLPTYSDPQIEQRYLDLQAQGRRLLLGEPGGLDPLAPQDPTTRANAAIEFLNRLAEQQSQNGSPSPPQSPPSSPSPSSGGLTGFP